jgi:hypothetical protein
VRVHLGDLVHPGHSSFASEDAARQRPNAHPDVHGITGRPAEMARMIAELGNGKLEYSCQPQVPLLTVMIQLSRMASPRPSPALRVPPPVLAADPGIVREWKQQGYKNFLPALAAIGPGNENSC